MNDRTLKWTLEPRGFWTSSIVVFILFSTIPALVACLMVYLFIRSFYAVKVNTLGRIQYDPPRRTENIWPFGKSPSISSPQAIEPVIDTSNNTVLMLSAGSTNAAAPGPLVPKTRSSSVLIATLEYEIPAWKIKVRIGGLGVIASLMARHITDKYLVWVIPKVGSVEYPQAQEQEPVIITLLDRNYRVDVQMLQCGNIKYILLEAPIFRSRSPSEPYPSRMDDLEAATFYSCWNQCIASIIEREKVDIFHVNDYHCALAPLYLLPKTIPVALSIHNGEFQGLFPLRTEAERKKVCSIFNIPVEVCVEYAQFGNTLNLLHAIVSYIRLHQNGTGAAGVSDKYGERCV